MKAINEKIKEFREDAGLTQSELADRMGISEKTIQRYEKGTTIPSTSQLKQIGDILGQNLIIKEGNIYEGELIDLVIQNNAMLSVSLDAMAELLASSSKKTVSEARSSLAKAVEHRIEILKGKNKT